MVSKFDSRYLKLDKETSEGHYAQFSFVVQHFSTLPNWQFNQLYHTNCRSLPTSWEIEIKSEEKPSNSCLVSLSRIDYINRPIDAHIWVSCFDIHQRRLSFPKVFGKKAVRPYEKVQGNIEEMIPSEEMRYLGKGELIVEVSVSISLCHKGIMPSAVNLISGMKKMEFSKL
ncbi:unnamed protein product [Larinioides sclopetarius]|uniref:MATH domain-containing protein n=1 Tax=Larinioides sclopetarius TaxID=280406 RepID=A0AAV2B1S1_9ARAC